MIVVQVGWLGPAEIAVASAPYLVSLLGAELEILSTATGEAFPVPLIHAWAFQLAGVVPVEVPLGPATDTDPIRAHRLAFAAADELYRGGYLGARDV